MADYIILKIDSCWVRSSHALCLALTRVFDIGAASENAIWLSISGRTPMPTQRDTSRPSSSILRVSKCNNSKLNSAVLASPSTSSCRNMKSIQRDVEYLSATDTLVLRRCDDKKDEDDRNIDSAAALVETEPRSLKRDCFELDKPSFEDEKDQLLSVSALQHIPKSSTDPKGTKGAEMQHKISKRTDAVHHNIGMDRIWLSNGISRPKYDRKQESSVIKEPNPQLHLIEQAGRLDACIEECTRRVDAMIAEGIDALAAQTSHQEELVFELTSGGEPDNDGLYSPAAFCRGWTSTQSNLIRDIENLLE